MLTVDTFVPCYDSLAVCTTTCCSSIHEIRVFSNLILKFLRRLEKTECLVLGNHANRFRQPLMPSPTILLGTFAGVNGAATVFRVILRITKVSGKILWVISCGTFSKEQVGSSHAYKFKWIFPLALNLGATALNAWMTVTVKGYHRSTMPRLWDLMLFYYTRPRIGWVPLALLAFQDAGMENPRDGPWTSAGQQAAIAESILQVIGVHYMGRTVHFGAIHGYFLVHHAEFHNGSNLLVMIIELFFMFCIFSMRRVLYSSKDFTFTTASRRSNLEKKKKKKKKKKKDSMQPYCLWEVLRG